MIGRYPFKSAWGFRGSARDMGSSQAGRINNILPLLNDRQAIDYTMWDNWWLGNDNIVAKATYDSGFATLKRWDGSQWIPATLKIYEFR